MMPSHDRIHCSGGPTLGLIRAVKAKQLDCAGHLRHSAPRQHQQQQLPAANSEPRGSYDDFVFFSNFLYVTDEYGFEALLFYSLLCVAYSAARLS